MGPHLLRTLVLPAIVLAAIPATTAGAQDVQWVHQFGTSDFDAMYSVDALNGDVYGSGEVDGAPGGCDVIVHAYRGAGDLKWSDQIDSGGCDFAEGMAAGGDSVYVGGGTNGSLSGANAGVFDAFLRRYDGSGQTSWTTQFGTAGNDFVRGAAADSEGVYVVGSVRAALPGQEHAGAADAFVRRYSNEGQLLWTRQFGTPGIDAGRDVALAAGGGIVVVGETGGALPAQTWYGGSDIFVRRYDAHGRERWTRQFGTPGNEIAWGVDVDGQAVYVAGDVAGPLPEQMFAGGPLDAFIRRYKGNGEELWTRQFGTAGFDRAIRVAAHGDLVAVVGRAGGSLSGQPFAGGATDPFIRLYDAEGTELWTRMFGSTLEPEAATGAVFDRTDGDLFVSGGVGGALPSNESQGYIDAFVMKVAT